jgi:hypothetical protein
MTLPVLLTVRGTLVPTNLEAARVLHNETAGSAQGIAAARSLGDLSHKVFMPLTGGQSTAKPGELLFLDIWCDPAGIGQFFSNPHVGEQAAKMFSAREGTVWMPATGAYAYHLPQPRGKDARYVGMIRGPIASPEKAIEVFASVDAKGVREARKRGQISHGVFIKVPLPGDNSGLELLAVDTWSDLDGMHEQYADTAHIAPLQQVFTGRPNPSTWEMATGQWNEW